MKLITTLAVVCLSASALAQGVRYDHRVATIATNYPPGAQVPVMAIPNAQVTLCVDGNCGTKAAIFSNQALTVPTSNPMQADGQGNFGFWAAAGTYFYKVVEPSGKVNGIYPITLGGTGGGTGTVVQVNGTPIITQSPVNFVNSASLVFSNPSAGIIQGTAAGGGAGCTTGGITPGDLLFPDISGNCLGSDNMQANGVQGGVNGADTLIIKTPSIASGDDFNIELLSTVDPSHNESDFGPHLWLMNCTNSGDRTLGCQAQFKVNDSGRPSSASGGLNPIWIRMDATQPGSHPGYTGIEIDQSLDSGIVTSADSQGVVVSGPSSLSGGNFSNVYGYASNLRAGTEAAGEEVGYLATTALGGTIASNYCDFVGRTGVNPTSSTPHESFGCGPTLANTFVGPTTVSNLTITGTCTGCGGSTSPLVASEEVVTFSATPTFSAAVRESTITMTAAISSFILPAGAAGQEKTLTFCENSTGGFSVTPPANVHGFMSITSAATASKCNSQHFTYNSVQAAWLADSPGVLNQ